MFLFSVSVFFFFNDTATTEIYTLSLHDALPILVCFERDSVQGKIQFVPRPKPLRPRPNPVPESQRRSEEHTSELQSRLHLVCRLLLEKKNIISDITTTHNTKSLYYDVGQSPTVI